MWNNHEQIIFPVPAILKSLYEKCLCHKLLLGGYFRLSVSPDRRKNRSPLCPLSLCGEKSVGFDSPKERSELVRLGKKAEDASGVKENNPITKNLWILAELLHHPEKGFARVDRIKKEALG